MAGPAPYPAEGQVWLDVAKSKATGRRHKVTIRFVLERENPNYCRYSPPSQAAVTYLPAGRRTSLSMQIEPFLAAFQFLA
ncbi:hypothetical protein [Methylobacterium sp. WL6]|uniref:hypothetical protein n=1 Tax=Methylobacterium sp. WL6 TaxID=2603901 RepID=UPI0011CCBB2D|nr:hypothetical protein [Methylobacterium sp. WL6]TXN63213.1 hypothetical protein FV230_20460 [Methylobacterium sp. WL6]